MPEIPLGAIDRLIRSCGVKRVTVETALELREIIEETSKEIISKAILLVENRNHTTLTKEDVKLAYKLLKNKD